VFNVRCACQLTAAHCAYEGAMAESEHGLDGFLREQTPLEGDNVDKALMSWDWDGK
jgi:hypothetical protein